MCEDNGNNESQSPQISESPVSEGVLSDSEDVDCKASDKPEVSDMTNVQLKLLVPSNAAGSIIGRSGAPITELQEQTGAKVKMSKKDVHYPDTTDRVCIITGTIKSVLQVYQYISEKIYQKPDTPVRESNREIISRHKQVKILVPNSTAGMIIGKKGAYIEDLKKKTGTFIQLSQKCPNMNLVERTVVIGGELEDTRKVVDLLVRKIAEDPQHASCSTLSYYESTGPVASAYSSGSPFASRSTYFHPPIFPTTSAYQLPTGSTGTGSSGLYHGQQGIALGHFAQYPPQNRPFGILSAAHSTTSPGTATIEQTRLNQFRGDALSESFSRMSVQQFAPNGRAYLSQQRPSQQGGAVETGPFRSMTQNRNSMGD